MKSILRIFLNTVSVVFLVIAAGLAHAQSNRSIINPGFENGLSNWNETEPAAESDKSRTGTKSAKLSGSEASVSQVVLVKPNTNYILSAYVLNFGRIGVFADDDKKHEKRIHSAEDWTKAEIEFNSESSRSVKVYADFYREEGQYDDFALTEKRNTATVTSTAITQCPGNGNIPIKRAYDDGSNDGNPPSNIIDGNLVNRWSSKGVGKPVTFDLGLTAEVTQLDVLWYKGSERINLFSVQTSIDGENWQTVLADASSISTDSFDSHNIENFLNPEARYIRVIGGGNSSNEWNSIIEAKIKGCVN